MWEVTRFRLRRRWVENPGIPRVLVADEVLLFWVTGRDDDNDDDVGDGNDDEKSWVMELREREAIPLLLDVEFSS